MGFLQVYIKVLPVILGMMTLLWAVSVILRNVSIVDIFWGAGFVLAAGFYFISTEGAGIRKFIVLLLAGLWGLRLSIYLLWRNHGKGEDFRYRQFRDTYGRSYWWISFFQTFLLQGVLMWLISAPLLGAQLDSTAGSLNWMDYLGILCWMVGFIFEAGGDYQLAVFKANPANKGKVLNTGFWRYTRHPNYFGDAAVWWGFGLICMGAGHYLPVLGSVLMTVLIIKVSGVLLLEKSLREKKPQYREYIEKTSAFLPWFPKK